MSAFRVLLQRGVPGLGSTSLIHVDVCVALSTHRATCGERPLHADAGVPASGLVASAARGEGAGARGQGRLQPAVLPGTFANPRGWPSSPSAVFPVGLKCTLSQVSDGRVVHLFTYLGPFGQPGVHALGTVPL